jgi:predicted patatin/cPLA2 family phospholipase
MGEGLEPRAEGDDAAARHEVLRALTAKVSARTATATAGRTQATGASEGEYDDGPRIVLAIEGGGMRGTVSGGMAFALHELGLVEAFDAVYGSSAGAISGAWLLSSNPAGVRGWTEPAFARALISRSGPLRGRPVADVRALVEVVYQTTFPMDFGSVLSSPVEFHPLATDTATGQSVDLRPLISDPAELRLALRASAAIPLLAGPSVELRGRRFYDAGVSESVPYKTAIAQGATHVLILRSRRDLEVSRGPSRSARLVARTALRRESAAFRATFLGRDARLAADDALLAGYDAAEHVAGQPAVFSIRPAAGSPYVSRLARDGKLLVAAFEAGRTAVHSALAGIPV